MQDALQVLYQKIQYKLGNIREVFQEEVKFKLRPNE